MAELARATVVFVTATTATGDRQVMVRPLLAGEVVLADCAPTEASAVTQQPQAVKVGMRQQEI